MAISYKYDTIKIELDGTIQVIAYTQDSTQPNDGQICIDHKFASGTTPAAINAAVATKAALVWSLTF